MRGGDRLNVVVILSDDERVDGNAVMTNVQRLLAEHGVTFTNFHVTTSECGPSRACILHRRSTRITPASSTTSGRTAIPPFDQQLEPRGLAPPTPATRPRSSASTSTTTRSTATTRSRPGWDDWQAMDCVPMEKYYDYTLNENGRLVHYGDAAVRLLDDGADAEGARVHRARRDKPFFLYFAPIAPHLPAIPAPQDSGGSTNSRRSGTRDRRARTSATSPGTPGTTGLLNARGDLVPRIDVRQPPARVALRARPLGRPRSCSTLAQRKLLDRHGDHLHERQRLPLGRAPARREDLAVRGVDPRPARRPHPWRPATGGRTRAGPEHRPRLDDQPSSPASPRAAAGRPQLRAAPARPAAFAWRHDFVVEYLGESSSATAARRRSSRSTRAATCTSSTASGWRELYDLRRDPWELRNLAPDPAEAALVRSLRRRLERLAAAPTHHVAV